MRKTLPAADICHNPTKIGSANANERALYASKKVALPITRRAFICHRENGTRSMRAMSAAAYDWLPRPTPGSRVGTDIRHQAYYQTHRRSAKSSDAIASGHSMGVRCRAPGSILSVDPEIAS